MAWRLFLFISHKNRDLQRIFYPWIGKWRFRTPLAVKDFSATAGCQLINDDFSKITPLLLCVSLRSGTCYTKGQVGCFEPHYVARIDCHKILIVIKTIISSELAATKTSDLLTQTWRACSPLMQPAFFISPAALHMTTSSFSNINRWELASSLNLQEQGESDLQTS